MTKLLTLNAKLQKIALSHPLARYNKAIAVLVTVATAAISAQYGRSAVADFADVIAFASVLWAPNAPKVEKAA